MVRIHPPQQIVTMPTQKKIEGLLGKFVTALSCDTNNLENALDHVISGKQLVTNKQKIIYTKEQERVVRHTVWFVKNKLRISEEELLSGNGEMGSLGLSFCYFYIRETYKYSYPTIAALFGKKSHSAVLKRVSDIYRLDPKKDMDIKYLDKIEKLTKALNNGRKRN